MTINPEQMAQYSRRAGAEVGSSVWYLGCLFTILADARETGGRFGLVESLSPKGTEPPRHVHSREDEAFYLLEGEITFYIGEETHEATPGTSVVASRGVPHSYTFETEEIRMLVLVAPGASRSSSGPRAKTSRRGRSRSRRPKAHPTCRRSSPRWSTTAWRSSVPPARRCQGSPTRTS